MLGLPLEKKEENVASFRLDNFVVSIIFCGGKLSCGTLGQIKLIDSTTGAIDKTPRKYKNNEHGSKQGVTQQVFIHSRNWLVSASFEYQFPGETIVWDLNVPGGRVCTFPAYGSSHWCASHLAAIEHNGEICLAIGATDGRIILQPLISDGEHEAPLEFESCHKGAIGALIGLSDGHLVSAGAEDHQVKFWKFNESSRKFTLEKCEEGINVRKFAFSASKKLLAGAMTNSVCLWNVAPSKDAEKLPSLQLPPLFTSSLPSHQAIHSIALSPDGNSLAISRDNNRIELYHIAFPNDFQYEPAGVLKNKSESGDLCFIDDLVFSDKGDKLFSGASLDDKGLINVHPIPGYKPDHFTHLFKKYGGIRSAIFSFLSCEDAYLLCKAAKKIGEASQENLERKKQEELVRSIGLIQISPNEFCLYSPLSENVIFGKKEEKAPSEWRLSKFENINVSPYTVLSGNVFFKRGVFHRLLTHTSQGRVRVFKKHLEGFLEMPMYLQHIKKVVTNNDTCILIKEKNGRKIFQLYDYNDQFIEIRVWNDNEKIDDIAVSNKKIFFITEVGEVFYFSDNSYKTYLNIPTRPSWRYFPTKIEGLTNVEHVYAADDKSTFFVTNKGKVFIYRDNSTLEEVEGVYHVHQVARAENSYAFVVRDGNVFMTSSACPTQPVQVAADIKQIATDGKVFYFLTKDGKVIPFAENGSKVDDANFKHLETINGHVQHMKVCGENIYFLATTKDMDVRIYKLETSTSRIEYITKFNPLRLEQELPLPSSPPSPQPRR